MTDDGRDADPDGAEPSCRERDRDAALFEGLPDPAARVESVGSEPVVRAVNPAFERVFGRDADAVRGEPLSSVVVPADGGTDAGTDPAEGAEPSTGAKPAEGSGGETDGGEIRRLLADGDAREFLCRTVPGADDLAYVVYTDVTARSRREATLRGLHEATRELVASEDREAVADRIVEACQEVLGFRYVSVRYHDPETDRLVPAAVAEAGREVFDDPRAFERGESLAWEVLDTGEPAVYADIAEHDAAITDAIGVRSLLVLPIGDHGTLNVAAAEPGAFDDADVSTARILAANASTALDRLARERELRERERDLRRQNERLEEFASVVSHDLRNPLSVAEARLSSARAMVDDEPAAQLEKVADALGRMERLIGDLLDLARKGQAVGETRPVDLGEAARQAWGSVSTGDATLSVATDATVEADPERLRTVFENLFRNAVEHGSTGSQPEADDAVEHGATDSRSPADDSVERGARGDAAGTDTPVDGTPDGVEIEVGTVRRDGAARVYVADDGPGVPPAERERVFASGHSPGDGTGIGLAVVRRIAEAHGWTAKLVESESGGARVELRDVEFVEEGPSPDGDASTGPGRGGSSGADAPDAPDAPGDPDDPG